MTKVENLLQKRYVYVLVEVVDDILCVTVPNTQNVHASDYIYIEDGILSSTIKYGTKFVMAESSKYIRVCVRTSFTIAERALTVCPMRCTYSTS